MLYHFVKFLRKNHTPSKMKDKGQSLKKSINVISLTKKKEIAVAILKKNQGYKKIVKEFGITQHQAREISKRKKIYALHTDEIIDENKTYSISKENKHFDFDEFMMEKIKNLRSKKVKLGFEILKSIARNFPSII